MYTMDGADSWLYTRATLVHGTDADEVHNVEKS